MDNSLRFRVVAASGERELIFPVRYMLNGGWAGRDAAAVQRHVDELASHGIAPPSRIPSVFPVSNNLATTSDRIQALTGQTSGEGEYVLLLAPDGLYVTIASDHTDRELERQSVQASKQVYPNVLAPRVWPYEEVVGHWDELRLRCWATLDGQRSLYHDARLAALLHPETWLELLREHHLDAPGTVFLSGAVATLGGLIYAQAYDLELSDPVLGRTIEHHYEVELLGPGLQ